MSGNKIRGGLLATVLSFSMGATVLTPSSAFAEAKGGKPAVPPKPAAGAPKPAAGAPKPAAAPKGPAIPPAKLAEARKRYTDGEKKFKAKDYAGALEDFLAAESVKSTPQTARYIGLCSEELKKYPEAVAAYERFLTEVPKNMTEQAEDVRERVGHIKSMPGKVRIETVPAGAKLVVDGKPVDAPTPTEVELPPGKHTVTFSADGRKPAELAVEVAYASNQTVKQELEAKPEPPPAPPPVAVAPKPEPKPAEPPPAPAEPKSNLPAYITGGLAVASAGVGTVFGLMALGSKSDFDKKPTTGTADDAENRALIADMAFGVALTLGVTSLVLFLSNDDAPASSASSAPRVAKKSKPKVLPAPFVTPTGGGAGATVRF